MPSVQKHIKGPSAMMETYSRSTMEQTAEMVNVGWTWGPCRGGLDIRVKQQEPAFLHSFSSLWNCPSSHGLSASCPSFQAHPKHTLPWNHPGLVSLPAGFCLHLSFLVKDPSYSAPSFVHMHMASHSSWGVRSVYQALFWNLMLIISNPHSKLHSKCWPHFTDEETEKLWPHHWSEGGQLLNRRVGVWMSSCQFRVFCSFTSCCPGGDWRYVWNEDNT